MTMADNIVMSEMSWTEVEEALKERPVGIVPVGAIEAHGPHLPLATDTLIALDLARRGAALLLKKHGVASLILPSVSYTVSEYAAAFPGTLSIPAETATHLLRDIAITGSKQLRAIAFANIHFDPAHVECIKKAVDEANKAGASCVLVDVTKKRWAERLGKAFLEGDHAGAFETSCMMAAAPHMVRERERISVAPLPGGLLAAMKKGAKTFAEAGGEEAYFGDPSAASADDGETWMKAMAEILVQSVLEHLGSKA
jgi:creatinine amidohydrolase